MYDGPCSMVSMKGDRREAWNTGCMRLSHPCGIMSLYVKSDSLFLISKGPKRFATVFFDWLGILILVPSSHTFCPMRKGVNLRDVCWIIACRARSFAAMASLRICLMSLRRSSTSGTEFAIEKSSGPADGWYPRRS